MGEQLVMSNGEQLSKTLGDGGSSGFVVGVSCLGKGWELEGHAQACTRSGCSGQGP